ncbi:MAG: hypothetical protein AAF587_14080 [Bacteroidota bacterium]
MKRFLSILSLCFLLSSMLCAQEGEAQHAEEGHHAAEKEKGIYEVITSGVYVYSFAHQEAVGGTEVHFTYWFTHTWGSGLSYTAKFEQGEILQDMALLGSMNPYTWMTLNVGPNFALPTEHREFSLGFYAETEINIRPVSWFHFGPVLGTVIGTESEGTVGFHLGFEF